MSTCTWAYCKIKAWALWRTFGIKSPSVFDLHRISHPVMFSAGNFRDHRYAGVTRYQQSDLNAALRKAMGEVRG